MRSGTVIYFEYDSFSIRADYLLLIAVHARFADRYGRSLPLEGHTDERGSREYNIGVGERRAQAVKQALALQGLAESQLRTVSCGEERPAANGASEASWSLNRRVEILLP